MTVEVLVSVDGGERFHKMVNGDGTQCGSLQPQLIERRDIPQSYLKGRNVEKLKMNEAVERGYSACGRCFAGGEQ